MLPRHRLVLTALAFGLIVFIILQFPSQRVSAVIGNVTVTPDPVTNPDTATIQIAADETNGDPIRVSVESGTIVAAICTSPISASETCQTTMSPTSGGATVSITASDGDGNANEAITLFLALTPPTVSATTDVDIFVCQEDNVDPCSLPNTANYTLEVRPSSSGTPTRVSTITYTVEVTADPNILPCGGGFTELKARAVNVEGGFTVRGLKFQFKTDYGDLFQEDNDSAILTIKPGMLPTGVAKVVVSSGDGQSAELPIRLACEDIASVVVTASPNVVQCGGTSRLTATVRDHTGHLVTGVGFHFATNQVLLDVGPPNTAEALDGEATLKISPGMTQATVVVSVGGTLGTVELNATGQVTVQQFCPSYSTTPSLIALTASKQKINCGGSTFIAALVRDISGNPAPDNTELTFLTDTGRFGAGSSGSTTASSTPSASTTPEAAGESATTTIPLPASGAREVKVKTIGGAANIIYVADALTSGAAHITAAGGASFGSIDIQLECVQMLGAPNGGGGGAVMGARISPPNTGDGGLEE
jgi:hypothetical protein